MFHIYKSALKRLSSGDSDRLSEKKKHIAALRAVTPLIAEKEFAHCGVPMGNLLSTATKRKAVQLVTVGLVVAKRFKI